MSGCSVNGSWPGAGVMAAALRRAIVAWGLAVLAFLVLASILVAAAACGRHSIGSIKSRVSRQEPVKAARVTDSRYGRGGWQLEALGCVKFTQVRANVSCIYQSLL
jgi:hypothetical protein